MENTALLIFRKYFFLVAEMCLVIVLYYDTACRKNICLVGVMVDGVWEIRFSAVAKNE